MIIIEIVVVIIVSARIAAVHEDDLHAVPEELEEQGLELL